MTFESINLIYGTAQNPWDRTKSPGGSSGGEGAAISGRLSCAGLGSDIAGSVRNPASIFLIENHIFIIFIFKVCVDYMD